MDIKPSTIEQVIAFKKAAADRYAELGVPPKLADMLFNNFMYKIAYELGFLDNQDEE